MPDFDPALASISVAHGSVLVIGVLFGLLALVPLLLAVMPVLRRARDARIAVGLVSVGASFVILSSGVVAVYLLAPEALVAFVAGELIGFFVGLIGLTVSALTKTD